MGQLPLLEKNKRYRQGFYHPRHPEKFVSSTPVAVYRSGLELDYFRLLDENPAVVKWGSEDVVVPYFFNNGWHRYFIDLFVVLRQGEREVRLLVELKPRSQTVKPEYRKGMKKSSYLYQCIEWEKNQAKWAAARKFAEQRGFAFHVLTEEDLRP